MRRIRTLAALVVLTACSDMSPGVVAPYNHAYPHKVEVTLPPGAPGISQQFRWFPGDRALAEQLGEHVGIDIRAPIGTPVLAAAPGRVTGSFLDPGYGHRIIVEHGLDAEGRPLRTEYMHLDQRLVEKGATVARGQQIGTLGQSGAFAFSPHLHFEVGRRDRLNYWVPSDPQLFWVDGPGQVTCLDPTLHADAPDTRLTYPVPCA